MMDRSGNPAVVWPIFILGEWHLEDESGEILCGPFPSARAAWVFAEMAVAPLDAVVQWIVSEGLNQLVTPETMEDWL